MPGPKIVIIGAGPAGLTFARILQNSKIPCTIFEAEADRQGRDQGGTLDLHPRGGQAALKAAGLFPQFQNEARPEAEALRLVDYTGKVIADENEEKEERLEEYTDRPEIDRVALRNILLDSIDPGTIKWGYRVSKCEADPLAKGKYNVQFTNGAMETGIDLLIGADGAWSKVRPLLTDVVPYYSGITGVELRALNVSKTNPWLEQWTGAGSNFMFDEGRAVFCQRNGNDSIRVYAALRRPESWKDDCGIDWSNGDEVRQTLVNTKEYFGDCGEDIKRSILECRDACISRNFYMLPVGHNWSHRSGVTLLGDSAHLMTPFAGVGVNLAMADAMRLAERLVSRKDSFVAKAFSDSYNIDGAVKSYESEMFERSEEYAKKTWAGLVEHFSKDGGVKMRDRVRSG